MQSGERGGAHILRAVFVAGLALSALLVARSQVGGDQLNFLARGWLFAVEGLWIQHGLPTSAGGAAPGGVTALLAGVPLMLWQHHRAPVLLVLLSHLLAYWLLHRMLRQVLDRREQVLFALLYWLSPARLFHSGHLLNSNLVFLFGAAHAATAFAQRERASPGLSFLHVLILGIAFQLHGSALLLAAASGLLVLRGFLRIHWPGAILGAAAVAASLLPWWLAIRADPTLLPGAEGFPGRGLVLFYPLFRGVMHWLRYPSLYLSNNITVYDFSDALGTGADALLAPAAAFFTTYLARPTMLLGLAANVWLWRRAAASGSWRRFRSAGTGREWLEGYVLWSFLAAVAVYALSPTTIMWWQGLILFHAAVIPMTLWVAALLDGRRRPLVRRLIGIYAAAGVLLTLALAFGSPLYRCAGRGSEGEFFPLHSDHPMLHELGIQRTCPFPLNEPGAWWPDVLPVE